jgi:hypothetical protein
MGVCGLWCTFVQVAGHVPRVPFFIHVAFRSPIRYVPMSDRMDAHGVSRYTGSQDGSIDPPPAEAVAPLQSELMEIPSPSPCERSTPATYVMVSLNPAQWKACPNSQSIEKPSNLYFRPIDKSCSASFSLFSRIVQSLSL